MKVKIPRIMISALNSGGGKTTVTCGILKALKNRGINVSACKCGPDYIDPMFHKNVLGIDSKNLDSFFCDENLLKSLFYNHGKYSDITVIEGVMGYYDGSSVDNFRASSYDVARILKIPVVIVINGKGMALTAASIIKGLVDFKKDSNIKGVILNNISKNSYTLLKDVIEKNTEVDVIGYLPYDEEYFFESRHLGLVSPCDLGNMAQKIKKLGRAAEECIDIEKIVSISENVCPISFEKIFEKYGFRNFVKIGVAFDSAFCFYYKDNIELLERLGCEIVYFSPIMDEKLPSGISGVIFGGGYPELYLEELNKNIKMRSDVKMNIENGMPCLAECGGFMYLHKTVKDKENKSYEMVGIIEAEAFFVGKLIRFGYIELTSGEDCFLLKKGEKIKAHEFHYWDSSDNGNLFLAEKPTGNRAWECVKSYKNVICGFPHIFYQDNVHFAENFVKRCEEWGE